LTAAKLEELAEQGALRVRIVNEESVDHNRGGSACLRQRVPDIETRPPKKKGA
jgi:hypothetical protein